MIRAACLLLARISGYSYSPKEEDAVCLRSDLVDTSRISLRTFITLNFTSQTSCLFRRWSISFARFRSCSLSARELIGRPSRRRQIVNPAESSLHDRRGALIEEGCISKWDVPREVADGDADSKLYEHEYAVILTSLLPIHLLASLRRHTAWLFAKAFDVGERQEGVGSTSKLEAFGAAVR